jgi:hypothetical protein
VYTPQVLLQGRDLRDWHAEKRSSAAIAAAARTPARAGSRSKSCRIPVPSM